MTSCNIWNRLHKKLKTCLCSSRFVVLILVFYSLNSFTQESTVKSLSLFDGKTLNGWKTVDPKDKGLWYVVDSVITCKNDGKNITANTYLQTEQTYGDFEFRCLFRLSGDHSTGLVNSGIQYRSNVVNGVIVGYQADIGKGYWGDLYDEHRRAKLVGGDLSILRRILVEDGWNSYIIRVKANKHELYINGVKTCEYIEKDPAIPAKGVIAFQMHEGGLAKVEFRDITITSL